MDSIYTTTLTHEAEKRGIAIHVLDRNLPIFTLSHENRSLRCYNGLTDDVGAATFHLANDKGAANRFLRTHGFPVPAQRLYSTYPDAVDFLSAHDLIVVKPVSAWGAHGISTHIATPKELRAALSFARRYSGDILLEQCVKGVDWRLIYVDYRFVNAIQRDPAAITGDGVQTVKQLIREKNARARRIDPSNIVPVNGETLRCIESFGAAYMTILEKGARLQVRRTSNYHTGGSIEIVTEQIPAGLIKIGEQVARLFGISSVAIDFLVDRDTNRAFILEVSPDMAISPPEGKIVANAFLDFHFPETRPWSAQKETRVAFASARSATVHMAVEVNG
jgi:D-alanine-D-alanine ligase-like ATP-grasp enzyme